MSFLECVGKISENTVHSTLPFLSWTFSANSWCNCNCHVKFWLCEMVILNQLSWWKFLIKGGMFYNSRQALSRSHTSLDNSYCYVSRFWDAHLPTTLQASQLRDIPGYDVYSAERGTIKAIAVLDHAFFSSTGKGQHFGCINHSIR